MHLEVERRFLGTLKSGDLRVCSGHKSDWKAIADESVRIIECLGRRDPDEYATRTVSTADVRSVSLVPAVLPL